MTLNESPQRNDLQRIKKIHKGSYPVVRGFFSDTEYFLPHALGH